MAAVFQQFAEGNLILPTIYAEQVEQVDQGEAALQRCFHIQIVNVVHMDHLPVLTGGFRDALFHFKDAFCWNAGHKYGWFAGPAEFFLQSKGVGINLLHTDGLVPLRAAGRILLPVVCADQAQHDVIFRVDQFVKVVDDKPGIDAADAVIHHAAIVAALQIVPEQVRPAVAVGIAEGAGDDRVAVGAKAGAAMAVGDGVTQKLDADGLISKDDAAEYFGCFFIHSKKPPKIVSFSIARKIAVFNG